VTLLLDTQVLLWFLGAPERLRPTALRAIEAGEQVVFVSAVSVWEIELKRSLGKLDTPDDLAERLRACRFSELPLHARHALSLRKLPALHRDPFDRMLVAQALTDKLAIVTSDAQILAYPVKTLRA
jgi:PIN domain nuclease of toxin-antitoxin system